MKKICSLLFLMVILAGFSGVARADVFTLTTTLSGTNEVMPNASPGSGSVVVTVDTLAHTMLVQATFSGLTAGVAAAHIHCCVPPGMNAGIATTTPTFAGFPSGVTSGSYFNILDLTLSSSYNPAFVTAHGGLAMAEADFIAGLRAGLTYFNIHTSAFPGGEIRGQLQVVPEPATLLLLGTGLVGIVAARRRQQAGR